MDRANALGAFLRARRATIDPADLGLADAGGHRRVAGLRREEVAHLAGVSLHYYIRLEQGRDRHPSPSVINALADVLRLDDPARAHLGKLAGQLPPVSASEAVEIARPELVVLLEQWTEQAALLLGRHRNVLAANRLATEINPSFTTGTNLMREVFLDPDARWRYPDWEAVAGEGVAALRAAVGADVADADRDELVEELSCGSADFRRLWRRHEAGEKPSGHQRFHHPKVGTLDLRYEPLDIPYSGGQILYVFFARPGSDDARRLRLLSASGRGAEAESADQHVDE